MTHQERSISAWKHFVAHNEVEADSLVREDVLASWERCRGYWKGVKAPHVKRLTAGELHKKLEVNSAALKTALPIMKQFGSFLQEKSGILGIFSPEGTLLHYEGDPNFLAHHKFSIGSNFKEQHCGSNAVAFCMREKSFCEVLGAEHFNQDLWDVSACASPLWGGKFNFMGILAIAMPRSSYTIESATCMQAIASNINHEHHVHDLLDDQTSVLSLINDGVIVLSRVGDIKAVNTKACLLLDIRNDDMVALGNIANFVRDGEPFLSILKNKRKVINADVTVRIKNKQKNFILSASMIPRDKGMVCTIIDAKQIQKNAVKAIGFKATYTFNDIIGDSEVLQNAIQLSKIASQSNMTTLLLGESGTGKELFAHAIHNESARKSGPFVVVNCGAIPRDLIQSELFGYESGAFTGAATKGKPGKFELADSGTIFLDEIGEMPMESQASLLRFLQNKEVLRVGATNVKHVNVRIISATNRNLEEAVQHGMFRSDLFYRLCVLTINIPNLRSRASDIKVLLEYFLQKYTSSLGKQDIEIANDVMDMLLNHSWPGNIRELENTVEYMVNTTQGQLITMGNLPAFLKEEIQPRSMPCLGSPVQQERSLMSRERQAILDMLTYYNGNIRLSAQALGIARSALYSKMAKFSIDYASFRKR